jgi:hypothetical protein
MATSPDGLTWPAATPVDTQALYDDDGNSRSRGHQFFPALTFTQGRLMLLFYDSRLDHVRSIWQPNTPFLPDQSTGRFYHETWVPLGELIDGTGSLGPTLDDANLTQVRHTLDVRVGETSPGPSPSFNGTTRVSQFRYGTRGDETPNLQLPGFQNNWVPITDGNSVLRLQQLQENPPNLPMFKHGTIAFIGDYVDIAGSVFRRSATGWAFDTAPSASPVHYAVWTSNQDVRPPPPDPVTGVVDWSKYTPINAASVSLFDGVSTPPACAPGFEGTRNQNIYGSRITDGLAVSSPQNVKPLGADTRTFVVALQNTTDKARAVRMSIVPPAPMPASFTASFRNDGVSLQSIDVAIPRHASVFRTVFVRSPNAPSATLVVRADELDTSTPSGCTLESGACTLLAGGLSGAVTLNPPGVTPALVPPDGATDPAAGEAYAPAVVLANITAANITAANVTASNLTNANITAANVTAANVTAAGVINPDLANITAANVTAANVTAANVTAANITAANVTAANVTAANITAASVSDANYLVTNTGNTTASFHVGVAASSMPTGPLQLIVSKPSATPIGIGCQLELEPRNVVVVSVDDVTTAIVSASGGLADPNVSDPQPTNATVSLAPGETAQITLRGVFTTDAMGLVAGSVTPVVVPHAGGSFAAALLVASDGASLPTPLVGVPYKTTISAIGGTAPRAWSLVTGALPAGLALGADGTLSGTPTAAGTYTFTVQVTDSAATPASAQRTFTVTVAKRASATTLNVSPVAAVYGQVVTATATVSGAGGGSPSGAVTFRDGGVALATVALQGGIAVLAAPVGVVGAHALTVDYPGDGAWIGGSAGPVAVQVAQASTTLGLTVSPPAPTFGQPVTLTATVTVVSPGAGMPTGVVTFSDGAGTLGAVSLVSGTASLTTSSLSAGTHSLTATYGGDGNFGPSTSAAVTQPVASAYAFTGFLSPLASAGTLQSPSSSGTVNFGSAVPIKWQLRDLSGAFVTRLSSTRQLVAYAVPKCAGAPPPTSPAIPLYAPTTGATGGSTFRYDSSSNFFIFNWDTSILPGKGCYAIVHQLDDLSPPRASIVNLK